MTAGTPLRYLSHLVSLGDDSKLQGVTAVVEGVHDQTGDHGQCQKALGDWQVQHDSPETARTQSSVTS